MATPAVVDFVQASAKPQSIWTDLFAQLIPLIADALQAWLEQCATTEDKAVELVTSPRFFQAIIGQRELTQQCRRNPEFCKLSRREQRQFVNETMADASDTANEQPELIVTAWQSVQA